LAGLDARTDSFMSMLLDVTGRVRPGDLPSVSEFDLPATMQAYIDAHPERQLAIDNGILSQADASAAPAAPVVVPPPAQVPPEFELVPAAAVAAPAQPAEPTPDPAPAFDPGVPFTPTAPEAVASAAVAEEPVHELVFQALPLDDTPELAPPPPALSEPDAAAEVDPASWFIAESADLTPPEGLVSPVEPEPPAGPSTAAAEPETSFEF
jgi:hypothetical protein